MGSRYGGLKQLDGVGPDGETIMDYSVFDAARAGFSRVVFVIRRDFEADFRARVLSRYADHIPTEVVFQSMDDLPDGFTCPPGRTKPWGTNHAVWMARHAMLMAEVMRPAAPKTVFLTSGVAARLPLALPSAS